MKSKPTAQDTNAYEKWPSLALRRHPYIPDEHINVFPFDFGFGNWVYVQPWRRVLSSTLPMLHTFQNNAPHLSIKSNSVDK